MTLDRPVSRLPEGMQLVPGGDYICGENGGEVTRLGRRIETLPTFAIARHPVTCAEYSEFLKDLPLTEARARAPRLAQGAASMWPEVDGRLIVPTRERCEGLGLSAQQYRLETCAGDWEDNWPALSMSWDDAQAFAEWKSQREGVKYRLPTEWEWEKAARGVDGRVFPWGEEFEPEWTNSIYSFEDGQRVVSVNQFPVDESPYGVRGMGGNTRDWCADSVPENPQMRMLRGGLWTGAGLLLRPALRVGNIHSRVTTSVGFRLAMDV